MKKSIKLLSLLLTATLLCVSMVSCDNGRSENNTTEAPTEVPTEAPTEAETEHTEHVGAGKCEVCGVDYYNTMSDYIKKNGVYNGHTYTIQRECKSSTGDFYEILVNYKGNIVIRISNELFDYRVMLQITEPSVKYGEYEWFCYPKSYGSLKGTLSPDKIIPNMPVHLTDNYSSYDFGDNSDKETMARNHSEDVIQELINDFFIPFLDEVGHDLTPSDFGFIRFED